MHASQTSSCSCVSSSRVLRRPRSAVVSFPPRSCFFVLSFISIFIIPFVPMFSFAFVSFYLDPTHTCQRSHQPYDHPLPWTRRVLTSGTPSALASSKVWTSCELARIRTTSCASSSSFYWLHCFWSASLLCPCSASSSIVNLTCCFCLVRTVSAQLFASSSCLGRLPLQKRPLPPTSTHSARQLHHCGQHYYRLSCAWSGKKN